MNLVRRLMFVWVRSRLIPSESLEGLGLDVTKPICYVFKSRSITDLFVLDYHCKKAGLPRPNYSLDKAQAMPTKHGSCIYLTKPGLIQSGPNQLVPSGLF